ncbi:MAG: enoyl-CoA hydratase/isomerase family protein [Chloroflexota bacterium]
MGIKYEKDTRVAYIMLDNPGKANVLDPATSSELSEAWKSAWEDRDVRAVVITGSGDRHFCGGHDITLSPDVTDEDRERLQLERLFWPPAGYVNGTPTGVDGRMGDHYPRIWKPVIAAVNGWAAGAGMYLLLASTDIRIACQEHARFKFALLSNGWLGNGPGATLLTRQLRYADAMRILLADEPFGADEAARIGLINETSSHGELMARAAELAQRITRLPPTAVRMMKEFAVRYRDVPEDEAWRAQNLMNELLIHTTADGEEGRRAFNEKREPDFRGTPRRRGDPLPELTPEQQERLRDLLQRGEF